MSEKKEVVNVRLDSTSKTLLEEKAAAAGLTVADYLRKLINDAQAQNKAPEGATVVTLHPTIIEALASVLSTVVSESLPQYFELSTPVQASPIREYLRKISGLEPESENTLTVDEEEFINDLRDNAESLVKENLLKEENAVYLNFKGCTNLQETTFKNIIKASENIASDKMPSLTSTFHSAITTSFYEYARLVERKDLFKQTFGMEYREFKAIFGL
jgi:hypothetical protein